jgi:hypothetical protein
MIDDEFVIVIVIVVLKRATDDENITISFSISSEKKYHNNMGLSIKDVR